MVVCVFDLLFICTVIIKCYSHYICSVWGRVLLFIWGELAAYVEDYVEHHPNSLKEEWIWMGRQPQDDHMRRQDLSGGSYGMASNNILLI